MSKVLEKIISISKPNPTQTQTKPQTGENNRKQAKAQISNQIPTSKTNIRRSKGEKTHPTFVRCVFLRLIAGGADAETWAKNNGYTFIAQ